MLIPRPSSLLAAFICISHVTHAADSNIDNQNKSICCIALSLVLGSKLSYPSDRAYILSSQSYFSQQANELSPICIITPTSSKDVSLAISSLSVLHALSGCQFAIRGGGHTPFAGSANINNGVVINMQSIKGVEVNSDQSLVSVGAGETWGDIYMKLDVQGLSAAGGRVSRVGVGGLTLGGGLSFFSGRRGFVCDNVLNYEVVLANGRIVHANANENSDLWLALRGGSNNFGVVTRFDMKTFKQGQLWGGTIFYNISTVSEQLKAFFDLNSKDNDPDAALIMNFGYGQGQFAAVNYFQYAEPIENPSVFQPLVEIQPQFLDTIRISNLTDFTHEQSSLSVNGLRETFMTTTFKNNLLFLKTVYDMWNSSLSQVIQVPDITYSVVFEPLPPSITSKSALLGGNSLGLNPSDGPLVVFLLVASWTSSHDDSIVINAGRKLVEKIDEAAEAKGLGNSFKYLNYAEGAQDPISGYGAQNKAMLQAASKKYDPQGLFQQAVPGGFKLFT